MDSLRNTWKDKLVPALAALLGGLFTCLMTIAIARHSHFATPIDAICRELFTGSTVGRQALVGNLWFAPLPTLIHLPIAALLPAKGAFSAPFATLLICHGVTVWLLWRFLRRHASRWIALGLYAVTLGVYSAFWGSFEAPFHLSWSITGALAFYVIFKLSDWSVTRRLEDWILFFSGVGFAFTLWHSFVGLVRVSRVAFAVSDHYRQAQSPTSGRVAFSVLLAVAVCSGLMAFDVTPDSWQGLLCLAILQRLFLWNGSPRSPLVDCLGAVCPRSRSLLGSPTPIHFNRGG